MKCLPLQNAIVRSIGSLNKPVITNYEFGRIVHSLYTGKKHKNKVIRPIKDSQEKREYQRYLDELLKIGILTENKAFPPKKVFNILNPQNLSNQSIICSVDPFAYISHFSAMEYYGLTDKIVKALFFSTLSPKEWRIAADEKLKREVPNYENYELPKLVWLIPNKLGKETVYCHRTKKAGGFQNIVDSPLRVSKIGRTFLDMLQKPEFCGGIYHIIQVYQEYARQYIDLIISTIDIHGKVIDKVRAGYILEELCKIDDGRINQWLKFAQRGGSRKLDAIQEYRHVYSEKWCLSINIEI